MPDNASGMDLPQTDQSGRDDDEEHASSIGQLRIANTAKKLVNRHSGVGQMTDFAPTASAPALASEPTPRGIRLYAQANAITLEQIGRDRRANTSPE
jgi:hypothetical protein